MNRKYFLVGAVAVAVVLAIIGFALQMDSSLETLKAQYTYFEDAIEVRGIVIREEDVYTKESNTVFESLKSEGDRVAAGSNLGTVYGKDTPKDVINSITEINGRISELKIKETGIHSEYDDVSKVESHMALIADELVTASQLNDGNLITSNKAELDRLLQNKLEITGKVTASADELSMLEHQKKELESGLSKTDVTCRTSGLLTYAIDGFEGELTKDIISILSPESLNAWLDYNPDIPLDAYSKIVSNNSWYFAFNITVNQLDNIKVGDYAYIKTTKESVDLIPVSVYDISESSDDGLVTVTVECSRDINSVLTNRKMDLVFVKSVYEGYKIPIEAVHVKEGTDENDSVVGVYALMGGIVEFRPVKISYSGEDYIMISNVYDEKTNRIHMFDEIIISTEGIKEGMLFT